MVCHKVTPLGAMETSTTPGKGTYAQQQSQKHQRGRHTSHFKNFIYIKKSFCFKSVTRVCTGIRQGTAWRFPLLTSLAPLPTRAKEERRGKLAFWFIWN